MAESVGKRIGELSALEMNVLANHWSLPMPFPLSYSSAEPVVTQTRDMELASDMFDNDPPKSLFQWARTMLEPDLRVECWLSDPRLADQGPSTTTTRICAVRSYDKGFVAVQRPGIPEGQKYESIQIYETHAVDLANSVVAATPSSPAGEYGDIDSRTLLKLHAAPEGEEYPKLSNQVTLTGTLQVREGMYSEWRLDDSNRPLLWTHRADLGRYVEDDEGMLACDDTQLVAHINRRIKVVVNRIREKRARIR